MGQNVNYHHVYLIYIDLGLRRRRESTEGKYVTDPTQLPLKFQRPRSRTSSRYVLIMNVYIAL